MPKAHPYPNLIPLIKKMGSNLVVFDLETTGFGKEAGIVQIAMVSVTTDGIENKLSTLLNPKQRINPFATKVHGIRDHDVQNAPLFRDVAPQIIELFNSHVSCGFNSSSCDLPIIKGHVGQKIDWDGIRHLDVRHAWCAINNSQKGKLAEVAQQLKVAAGKAHDALDDVMMTIGVLDALVGKYGIERVLDGARLGLRAQSGASSRATIKQVPMELLITSERRSTFLRLLGEQIHKNGTIDVAGINAICQKANLGETSGSFIISDLLEKGRIATTPVRDPRVQESISRAIVQSIKSTETGLLKPVRLALQKLLSGVTVDYVQLRVAIMEAAESGRVETTHPVVRHCWPEPAQMMSRLSREGHLTHPEFAQAFGLKPGSAPLQPKALIEKSRSNTDSPSASDSRSRRPAKRFSLSSPRQ